MKGLWIAVAGVLLTGCATLQYGSPQASAELKNAKGEVVGTASFWQDAGGVRVVAQVRGLSAGKHGTHLHAVGKCDPPEFTTPGW
jgi:Cu-Zn family superoxide dismutase